jgi:hypothetical protein
MKKSNTFLFRVCLPIVCQAVHLSHFYTSAEREKDNETQVQALICLLLRQGVYCRSSKVLTRHGENGSMSLSYLLTVIDLKVRKPSPQPAEPEIVNV